MMSERSKRSAMTVNNLCLRAPERPSANTRQPVALIGPSSRSVITRIVRVDCNAVCPLPKPGTNWIKKPDVLNRKAKGTKSFLGREDLHSPLGCFRDRVQQVAPDPGASIEPR